MNLKLQDKIEMLQTYDLSLYIGQSYILSEGAKLYLIFEPLYYILKKLGNTEKAISWRSKGLSFEKFTTLTTTSHSPSIKWYGNSDFCSVFKRSYLKPKKKKPKKNKKMQLILLLIE